MESKIRCLNSRCNKILLIKSGKKRLNPKRKYCNPTCQTRQKALERYYKLRNDPEYLKQKSNKIKDWYKKNKKHQNENILKQYFTHKKRWLERKFVDSHRNEFLNLINKKCVCGKPVKVIHHITYSFNRNWKSNGRLPNDPFNLWEYSNFLIGFCSKKCHGKYHRKLNETEDFLSLENVCDILKRTKT